MTPIGCNSEPVPDLTTADLRRLWDGFCDDLKAGADHVLDPDQPWDATDRTEGLRHLLRSLARGVSTTIEGGDHEHPELAWVHPMKFVQDNPDGLYQAARVDFSHRDPGIANWLDTTGASQGCITYRWNQSASAPVPSLRLVPFDDVADHLAADTARLTPDERAGSLRRRCRGALRRFRR